MNPYVLMASAYVVISYVCCLIMFRKLYKRDAKSHYEADMRLALFLMWLFSPVSFVLILVYYVFNALSKFFIGRDCG